MSVVEQGGLSLNLLQMPKTGFGTTRSTLIGWHADQLTANIFMLDLTLYLLLATADYLCKQFGPRSGPAKCQA